MSNKVVCAKAETEQHRLRTARHVGMAVASCLPCWLAGGGSMATWVGPTRWLQ